MDMSLSSLQKLVMDREAWHAAVHGVTTEYWTELNWTESMNGFLRLDVSQPQGWSLKTWVWVRSYIVVVREPGFKGQDEVMGPEAQEKLSHSGCLENRPEFPWSRLLGWRVLSPRTSESGCFPTVLENSINNLNAISPGCFLLGSATFYLLFHFLWSFSAGWMSRPSIKEELENRLCMHTKVLLQQSRQLSITI